MGRKGKRGGIVWNTDPSTGAPTGAEVNAWDGVSRTHKRNQARALITQRRDALVAYIALDPDQRRETLERVRLDFEARARPDEEFPLSPMLIEQLDRLAQMKRGGAKQRQIKHLSASLDEHEWDVILEVKELVETSP